MTILVRHIINTNEQCYIMCLKRWSEYSLKRQLLTIFTLFASISLFCVGISCIIFIVVVGNSVENKLHDGFLETSKNDMIRIATHGSQLFDKKLDKLTSNFPNVMAISGEDSFRNDNIYGFIPSHYNWPNQLINASYNSKYDANVTTQHSTVNVYNKTYFDLPTFFPQINNIIDRTASMDYLFIPTFKYSQDFFAGYMATPERFLRYYPGAINYNNISKYVTYDNVGDYWYDTVMSNPNSVTYTSPYLVSERSKVAI